MLEEWRWKQFFPNGSRILKSNEVATVIKKIHYGIVIIGSFFTQQKNIGRHNFIFGKLLHIWSFNITLNI